MLKNLSKNNDNNNYNNNNNNKRSIKNNNYNNNNIPMVLKYQVGIRPGITMSHGQAGVFIALDGSLPRDGVSIKTLVVVTPHHHKPLMNENFIE